MNRPRDPRTYRVAARRLAVALQRGSCPADAVFDRFLPEPLRVVSPQYWSPLVVVKQASQWFDDLGIRTAADIGSGAGKFCVAGALFGQCRFVGLERCPPLVASARALARMFDVDGRVHFVRGALGEVHTPVAEAYYFFNPFGEYHFGSSDQSSCAADASLADYFRDIALAERLLRRASPGTWALTYNGFGGRIPGDYRLVRATFSLPGGLRLWRKTGKERFRVVIAG
jgi:predicted RNA methylase